MGSEQLQPSGAAGALGVCGTADGHASAGGLTGAGAAGRSGATPAASSTTKDCTLDYESGPDSLSASEKQAAYAKYPAPSKKELLVHLESVHPRDSSGKLYPFWRTSPGELGEELGVGIALYFRTLSWLSITMFLMWVLHIPQQLMSLSAEQYLADYKPTLNSFTLGGLAQQDEPGMLVLLGQYTNVFGDLTNKQAVLIMVSVCDLLSVLVFVGVFIWIYWKSALLNSTIDRGTISIDDYTIVLRPLPHDATQQEVEDYIHRVLPKAGLHEVVIVRKIAEVLAPFQKRANLLRSVEALEAEMVLEPKLKPTQLSALEKKKGGLEDGIAQLERSIVDGREQGLDAAEAMVAFITFEQEVDKEDALDFFPANHVTAQLMRHHNRLRQHHPVWAHEAESPSNYLFENLSYQGRPHFYRKLAALVLVVLVLGCSLAFSLGLRVAQQDQINAIDWDSASMEDYLLAQMSSSGVQGSDVDGFCTPLMSECAARLGDDVVSVNLTYGAPVELTYTQTGTVPPGALTTKVIYALRACTSPQKSGGTVDVALLKSCVAEANPCYTCYCNGLSQNEFSGNTAASLRAHCAPFITDTNSIKQFKFGMTAVTIVINLLFSIIMKTLVRFSKYETASRNERALTFSTASAQIINTAVVPALANAAIQELNDLSDHKFFSVGYPDLTHDWYMFVGSTMIITVFTQIFIKGGISILKDYIIRPIKRFMVRRGPYTQDALNKLHEGSPFLLADKMSILLFYTTIAVMWGLPLPLLFLVASVALALEHLLDKHRLLRKCQKPTRYDDALNVGLLKAMPIMLILHLALGAWAISYFRTSYVFDVSTSANHPPITLDDLVNGTQTQLAAVGAGAPTGVSPGAAPPAAPLPPGLTMQQLSQLATSVASVEWSQQLGDSSKWSNYSDPAVWAESSSWYNNNVGRYNPARLLQVAAFILLVPLCLAVLYEVLDLLLHRQFVIWLNRYMLCCLPGLQHGRLHGYPPLQEVKGSDVFTGPDTYQLFKDPRYTDLFQRGDLEAGLGKDGGVDAVAGAAAEADGDEDLMHAMMTSMAEKAAEADVVAAEAEAVTAAGAASEAADATAPGAQPQGHVAAPPAAAAPSAAGVGEGSRAETAVAVGATAAVFGGAAAVVEGLVEDALG